MSAADEHDDLIDSVVVDDVGWYAPQILESEPVLALIEPVRLAAEAERSAKKALAADRSKEIKVAETAAKAARTRDKLRADIDSEAANQLLIDGELKIDSKLAKALEAQTTLAAAGEAAKQLQRQVIAASERRLADAKSAAAAPVIDLVTELNRLAVQRIKSLLQEFDQPLALLVAGDFIRQRTIGDTYNLPPGKTPPWSGVRLVTHFISEIPHRFRPPELEMPRVMDRGRDLATSVVDHIKGSIA